MTADDLLREAIERYEVRVIEDGAWGAEGRRVRDWLCELQRWRENAVQGPPTLGAAIAYYEHQLTRNEMSEAYRTRHRRLVAWLAELYDRRRREGQ